jgi:transposase-like protein
VFGVAECAKDGDAFWWVVEDRTTETLVPLMEKAIGPGTMVFTDGWRAYKPKENGGPLDYAARQWQNTTTYHNRGTYDNSQFIEGLWWQIKDRTSRIYGHVPGV